MTGFVTTYIDRATFFELVRTQALFCECSRAEAYRTIVSLCKIKPNDKPSTAA